MPPAIARPSIEDQQRSLLLHEHAGLETLSQVERFLATVGVALRYGPHKTLPIASMYAAIWRSMPEREPEAAMQRRATILTNQLIAGGRAMETNCIAERFLDGARIATRKQIAKIFEACMSGDEVDAALAKLARKIEIVGEGKHELVVRRA